jgi:hypothetical protein
MSPLCFCSARAKSPLRKLQRARAQFVFFAERSHTELAKMPAKKRKSEDFTIAQRVNNLIYCNINIFTPLTLICGDSKTLIKKIGSQILQDINIVPKKVNFFLMNRAKHLYIHLKTILTFPPSFFSYK